MNTGQSVQTYRELTWLERDVFQDVAKEARN